MMGYEKSIVLMKLKETILIVAIIFESQNLKKNHKQIVLN